MKGDVILFFRCLFDKLYGNYINRLENKITKNSYILCLVASITGKPFMKVLMSVSVIVLPKPKLFLTLCLMLLFQDVSLSDKLCCIRYVCKR